MNAVIDWLLALTLPALGVLGVVTAIKEWPRPPTARALPQKRRRPPRH
jgi:hypothetical protein